MAYRISYKVVSEQSEQLKKAATDMDQYMGQLDQIISKLGNDELLRTAREQLTRFRKQLEEEKMIFNFAGMLLPDVVQHYTSTERRNVQKVDKAKAHNRDFYKRPVVVASAGAGAAGGAAASAASAAASAGRSASASAASASASAQTVVNVTQAPASSGSAAPVNRTVNKTVVYEKNITNVYVNEAAPAADVSEAAVSADIAGAASAVEAPEMSAPVESFAPDMPVETVSIDDGMIPAGMAAGAIPVEGAVEAAASGIGAAGVLAAGGIGIVAGGVGGVVAGVVQGEIKKNNDKIKNEQEAEENEEA